MNEPILLKRRTPAETDAYNQGIEGGMVIALQMLETSPDKAKELLRTALEVHKMVRQANRP